MDEDIQGLIKEFIKLEEVEAFVLGGSRVKGVIDEKSDYDVYVYLNKEIPSIKRKEVLEKYCKVIEIGNDFWELEDDCTLNSGIDIDIIYRSLDQFTSTIKSVVEDFNSSNGYTTCMWHNLINSKVIFDRNNQYTDLQKKYSIPYPEKLKENIINKNMKLLSGILPSYDLQIKKAVRRNDLVSINHRVTEFLASYFDIIFAINEVTHPGEKKLVKVCKDECKTLPEDFEKNINKLFSSLCDGDIVNSIIHDMVEKIKALV